MVYNPSEPPRASVAQSRTCSIEMMSKIVLRVESPIPAPLEDLVMECLENEPSRRPRSAKVLCARLEAVPLTSAWTAEREEKWWTEYRPRPSDAHPVADILLSHEGRRLRIGPRARRLG